LGGQPGAFESSGGSVSEGTGGIRSGGATGAASSTGGSSGTSGADGGADTDTIAGGGVGQSGGEAGGGPDSGGDGGSAGTSAKCEADADCDDHVSCNGVERCEQAACVSGTSTSCADPLSCHERSGAPSCEFARSGPWFTFYSAASNAISSIGLYGVPSPYAVEMAPLELSQAALDGEVQVTWDQRWSADGRHLLLNVAGEQRALYAVDFGDGLPSPARALPNLPRDGGQYSLSSFARDTNCALAQERTNLYEVCFDGTGVLTRLVRGDVEELDLEGARFCAGADAVLVSSQLLDLTRTPAAPEALPEFLVSPDGKRLLRYGRDALGDIEHGLSLRPCAPGMTDTFLPLPPPPADAYSEVDWAPDSRHALVSTDLDPAIELALVDLDAASAASAVVWQGASENQETFEYAFSKDSEYLLVRDGSSFSLVIVATGTKSPLSLPPGVSRVVWGDDGATLLVERALEPKQASAAWWIAKPLSAPELVYESAAQGVEVIISPRAGCALVLGESPETSILRIDLNDLGSGARRLNLALPIGPFSRVEITPDGSGAVLESSTSVQANLYFISLLEETEGRMTWLNRADALFGEFQPWP
jgi:hypothetical protein